MQIMETHYKTPVTNKDDGSDLMFKINAAG